MDFTIRNLPAPVLEDLERAARLNGRSVEEEAIARLETDPVSSSFGQEVRRCIDARLAAQSCAAESVEERLVRIRALRERFRIPPLTQEFLDAAKSEGRA